MSYSVRVAPTAGGQLAERLRESVAAACIEFIFGALAENPHRVDAPLRAPFEGKYRARRGEYRVRYRMYEGKEAVYILDVDHQRDANR